MFFLRFFIFISLLSFFGNATASVWSADRPAAADLPDWASLSHNKGRFIYVDAAASPLDADGSYLKPFATIKKALEEAKPFDEVIIASGVYNESVRVSKPNITLRAAVRHEAKIITPHDDKTKFFALRIDSNASFTRIIGLDISGGYFYTVSLESSWAQSRPEKFGVSRVLLSQNRLHGSGRDVIKFKPMVKHVVIERNEIFNSGIRDSSNAEGVDIINSHFVTLQDNYIHSIATTGLYVKGGASNNIIQRNFIQNVGSAGVLVGFDTTPDFFDLQNNSEMYEAINTIVENNIIDNTQASGIGLYGAKNTLIRYNTIINSAQRYHGALFFGNTYQDRKPDAKRPASTDVNVFGNVFHVKSFRPVVNIRHTIDRNLGELPTLVGKLVMDNNVYAAGSGKVEFVDERAKRFFSNSFSFVNWQERTGTDKNSKEINISLRFDYSLSVDGDNLEIESDVTSLDYYLNKRLVSNKVGAVNK